MIWRKVLQTLFTLVLIQDAVCTTFELNISVQEEQAEGIMVASVANFSQPYQLLTEDEYLSLDKDTGHLYTTSHRMDRESMCPEQPVKCVRPHIATVNPTLDFVKLNVVVEDINDNAPSFHSSEIHLSVPEDVPMGTSFLLEDQAWDRDVGNNGEVLYSLDTDNRFFSVCKENTTPVVVLQGQLDREVQSVHSLILLATDYGFPPLTGTATLLVEVTDANDNCPAFDSDSPRNVTIQAGSPSGTVVTRVKASDPDLGSNAIIRYSFSSKTSEGSRRLFNLDPDTGQVTLSSSIDNDICAEHLLEILVTGPSCTPVATHVAVSILQVSPQPKINIKYIADHKHQTILLQENQPSTILAVLELSNRYGLTGTLSIEGEVPFFLRLQHGSYHLLSSRPLDFEQENKYDVNIVVGNVKKVIPVLVEDINDNPPHFHQIHYQLDIYENNRPETLLVRVTATDRDGPRNGKVVYRLIAGVEGLFEIDNMTGQISVAAALDREQQDTHSLTVVARDNGSPALEATATVTIHVLDQNDNEPVFIIPSFIFFIPENFPLLGRVGLVGASDADKGENGQLELQVLNGSRYFVVDNSQGTLRCVAQLDREQQDRYELWLLAKDQGQPSLSSTAKVTVFIEDVNDNQPHIILPNNNLSCLTVLPDMAMGATVTRIYAIDEDSGINSDISYHIGASEPPGRSPFKIDAHSGNITLAQHLLVKDYGIYHLLVVVRDSGRPTPLQSTVWVNLLVNTTSEPCHVNDVPNYLPRILPSTSAYNDEKINERAYLVFVIGLSMMAFSVVVFLGTCIVYINQRTKANRSKKYKSKVNEIPLKLMEDCHTDNWAHLN